MPASDPSLWRRTLYREYLARVHGDTHLPPEPPELRAGLVYLDQGWRVRRHGTGGALERRHLTCWRGHRLHLPQYPRDNLQVCGHQASRHHPPCDATLLVRGMPPAMFWACDLAPHEVELANLLSTEEMARWLDVTFPVSFDTARTA